MPGIDESLTFHPLRIAVLTVSDTRTEETDKSGDLLAERLTGAGHELAGQAIVTDEVEAIREQVMAWVADPRGGRRRHHRRHRLRAARRHARGDQAPVPARDGRLLGRSSTRRASARSASRPCSRAPSPARSTDTFVFCLPGSTGACRDGWDLVLDARARQPLPALLARRPGPAPQGALRMSELSHVDDGRPRAHGRRLRQGGDRSDGDAAGLRCAARRQTLEQVRAGTAPKGAVIQTAELAGVMAAKRTADLIPLCHPLPLTKVGGDDRDGRRAAGLPRRRRGPHQGVDRRRDGGADRGLGRLPHLVRHAQRRSTGR